LYDGAEWVNGAVATPTQLAAKLDATNAQVLGAWNLFQNNGINGTWNGATFIKNADDTVTVDIAGSAVTADINYLMSYADYHALPQWLQPGTTAYISGCDGGNYSVLDGGSDTFYIYGAFQDSNRIFISATTSSKGERQFTVPANAAYYRIGMIIAPAAGKLTNKVFSPMIALQPNMPYVKWVMTNRELTDKWNYEEYTDATYGFKCIRSGNVCTISFESSSAVTVDANTAIGAKLPERFRPKIQVGFRDSGANKRISIYTGGNVACNEALTNVGLRGGMSYIV
jgi:hypothetical protein